MLNKLDDLNFNIHEYKENDKLCGYEMETWTDNGINMIHFIDCRDYEDGITAENVLDQLKQISVNFDVDDEVYKLMESERARKEFSYRDAVNDFEAYENRLRNSVYCVQELYVARKWLNVSKISARAIVAFLICDSYKADPVDGDVSFPISAPLTPDTSSNSFISSDSNSNAPILVLLAAICCGGGFPFDGL